MNLEGFKKLDKPAQWAKLYQITRYISGFTEDLRAFEALVEVAFDRFNGATQVFCQAGKYIIVDVVNGDNHYPTQEVPEYARNISHSQQLMMPDADYTVKFFKDGSGYAHSRWKATDKHKFPEYNYVCSEEPMNYPESMPKTPEMALLTLLIHQQHHAKNSG